MKGKVSLSTNFGAPPSNKFQTDLSSSGIYTYMGCHGRAHLICVPLEVSIAVPDKIEAIHMIDLNKIWSNIGGDIVSHVQKLPMASIE